MLKGDEQMEFEAGLRACRRWGAGSRIRLGMYELWPLPAGMEFPAAVEVWLGDHGFVRKDDPVMGPFWERPVIDEMEVM